MDKTYISIEFWQLISFFLGFLGLLYSFGKLLFSRFENELKQKQQTNEKVHTKVEDLESAFSDFKAVLPLSYVLRDDYIRGQAILEAKVDEIQRTLTDIYKTKGMTKE